MGKAISIVFIMILIVIINSCNILIKSSRVTTKKLTSVWKVEPFNDRVLVGYVYRNGKAMDTESCFPLHFEIELPNRIIKYKSYDGRALKTGETTTCNQFTFDDKEIVLIFTRDTCSFSSKLIQSKSSDSVFYVGEISKDEFEQKGFELGAFEDEYDLYEDYLKLIRKYYNNSRKIIHVKNEIVEMYILNVRPQRANEMIECLKTIKVENWRKEK